MKESTQTLLDQILDDLGRAQALNLGTQSEPWDLYEAYVFCLVIKAAKLEGASVIYRDVEGKVPTTFVFRTSPGHIYSKLKPYTHGIITFPDKPPLEVHLGIKVSGRAGVLHECDVAVIEQKEAHTCRQQCVAPRSNKVPIAIECKFYASLLTLNLARSFIGLATDLNSRDTFFVSNSSSKNLEKLLSHHLRTQRKWEHDVYPKQTIDEGRFLGKLTTSFQVYKARS